MTVSAVPTRPANPVFIRASRHRGLFIAMIVFAALFAVLNIVSPNSYSFFDFSYQSGGGATLALAAIGQTLVVLTGGFDLSAAAVISLVNVVLASGMRDSLGSEITFGLAAMAIGGVVGAFNGFFIAFLRMQSIVVTLATMFIVQGVTLLIMETPGGQIPAGFAAFFNGAAIPNILPAPVVVLAVAMALWSLIKHSQFGTAIYAVGSDSEAASASGVRVGRTKFATYVLAGCFYGAAGAFISAQTGSADPLVGNSLILPMFAAVVVGGTALGGGRGGCIGSVIGAYILMIVVNVLLVLNVSAYYSTVAEGGILILAVLGASWGRNSPIAAHLFSARRRWAAWRNDTLPSKLPSRHKDIGHARLPVAAPVLPKWLVRHREALRCSLPAYVAMAVVLAVTLVVYGGLDVRYIDSLVVLSCFLAVLSLGQGAVILTGGLDLSLPWTIALSGILLAGTTNGANGPAIWAIPSVLAVGALIGLFNGTGVVVLGLPPIVITLATNGILEGLALVYCNGTPGGFAPPALHWLMTGRLLGPSPIVWIMVVFVVGATILLGHTAFGRRVYAVGNSPRVAYLSGVNVGATLMGAYMLSGICSALVGVMLAGFNGQASLGMGDEYLLPSIAVVVVGGALITGGRGHYLGMLGGVLFLTALQTMLAGTTLPFAVRGIIFGVVLLGAVIALRDSHGR
jgi:ribose transport system permease protein